MIPVLKRHRQVCLYEFRPGLVYTASSSTAGAAGRFCLKKKKGKKT